jgi:Holliday junction resolvase RusA-like endonuclease
MGEIKIVIPGGMPGFNEIVEAAKKHYHRYNDMKKENTELVTWMAKKVPRKKKIFLDITWIEQNMRRDPDNIAAAVKFIWDGLVEAGVITNDGWKQNGGWSNRFEVDKKNPRIEVKIKEVG